MSAELLREAAHKIRVDVRVAVDRGHMSDREGRYNRSVADWLAGSAVRADRTSSARLEHDPEEWTWYHPSLAVAGAYLGLGS